MKRFISSTVASLLFAVSLQTPAHANELALELPIGLAPLMHTAIKAIKKSQQLAELNSDPHHQVVFTKRSDSKYATSYKFAHYFKGIEVVGSQASVKLTPELATSDEEVTNHTQAFEIDTLPTLTADDAVGILISHWDDHRLMGRPELKILPRFEGMEPRLVYWVTLKPEDPHEPGSDFAVDAHSGDIVWEISHHQHLADIHVYSAANAANVDVEPDTGAPKQLKLDELDHVISPQAGFTPQADDSAKRAHKNAQRTLEYYMNRFDRNSFDDEGTRIINVVHAGKNWANAYWDGNEQIMAYGDGDGNARDMTLAVDVAGHEMTHGVISTTAALFYVGEAGAVNEAFADYFGKMIEGSDNWTVGHGLFRNGRKGIRDLANPASLSGRFVMKNGTAILKPYPKRIQDKFVTEQQGCGPANDRCYVHANSTIASHAMYQIHQAIGKEKAEDLLYETMVLRIPPLADFSVFRKATLKTCKDLFDFMTCKRVQTAFGSVGL